MTSDAGQEAPTGAVIVGIVPGEPSRVLKEAARYAKLLGAPLLVVNVDVTRFVTYEDPDGYVHSAPIDLNVATGESELAIVRAEASALLDGRGVDWSIRQLVGDPALAMKHLAEEVDA
ncbi:MAG: universal stress protein, partial [Microbacterium sp.]|nr:universal stress protein [Microbacterium sp.]